MTAEIMDGPCIYPVPHHVTDIPPAWMGKRVRISAKDGSSVTCVLKSYMVGHYAEDNGDSVTVTMDTTPFGLMSIPPDSTILLDEHA